MPTSYERAFADHPDVYAAWDALIDAIRVRMDRRRYELVTLAAALAIRSSYCALAHGRILAAELGEDVAAIARDPRTAGLAPVDVAVMELARAVALDATAVTEADRAALRAHGLTDAEVADVVLCAAARCFFSKALDGLGALPDASFATLDPALRAALVVGRPIEGDA